MAFSAADAQETGYGYITGKCMTAEGEASDDWRIRFFDVKMGGSPFTNEYRRIPDYFVRSGDDGSFSAKLPEGSYYVIAIRDRLDKVAGPPGEGDLIYPPMDGTEYEPYRVRADETIDLGVISGAVPFKKEWAAEGKTGIAGIVYDRKGRPLKRVIVLAVTEPDAEGPVFVSDEETDSSGSFIVRVPEGGAYYLKVRGYLHPDIIPVVTGEITEGIELHIDKAKKEKEKIKNKG
ncbi:MAG: hypothetical protein JSU90_08275 [Nitrospiraceae bacterium]|nr:MAG: hypothetical protein JSU90_08275 [Nitrospiraceae bacterium]